MDYRRIWTKRWRRFLGHLLRSWDVESSYPYIVPWGNFSCPRFAPGTKSGKLFSEMLQMLKSKPPQ